MPLETCPFLKTAYFQSLFSMWLQFYPNEEGREGGERELIYCPPCFWRVCGRDGIWNPESGIRNAEFATLFLLLVVENHFAFTTFFCTSFFKNYRILSRKSQKSFQPALGTRGGFPIQTVAVVERCLNLNILRLKRRYLRLINYDSNVKCKCEVLIRYFNLILLSLLSLFFLVFSFLSVIFGLSEKRTILA